MNHLVFTFCFWFSLTLMVAYAEITQPAAKFRVLRIVAITTAFLFALIIL